MTVVSEEFSVEVSLTALVLQNVFFLKTFNILSDACGPIETSQMLFKILCHKTEQKQCIFIWKCLEKTFTFVPKGILLSRPISHIV